MAAIVFTQGWAQAASSPTKVGLHETGGVDVPDGETLTLTDDVLLGDGGRFHKTGEGTLVMPMSKVNRQVSGWEVRNLGGTMRITAGDDATVTAAPAIIAQKAALWLNMDSVIVTNAPGDVTDYVKKWVDVRDIGTPDSPRYPYALPGWGSKATTFANIPPVRVTKDGRPALYFNGHGSYQHLKLSSTVSCVRNNFVVHGMYDCWGAVLGGDATIRGMVPGGLFGSTRSPTAHFIFRTDLNSSYAAGRFHKDGVMFDPYTVPPSKGFQLLECEFPARPDFTRYIFRSSLSTISSGETDTSNSQGQGGDYVSEVILFTNSLAEAERLDIERYLMRKWTLPMTVGDVQRLPACGSVASATNTVTELHAGTGEALPALELKGEGAFRKIGAGILEMGPSSSIPFSGDFTLDEGTVFSRGGRPPAMTAAPGDRFTGTVYTPYAISASRLPEDDMNAGATLTRTSDAAAKSVVKDGNDWARFNTVTGDVRRISVQGGTLALEAKEHGHRYVYGAPAMVAVTNCDFELPFTPTANKSERGQISDNPQNGWRVSSLSGYATGFYVAWTNSTSQKYFGPAGTAGRIQPPPSGGQALVLLNGNAATVDVEFPTDGDYELTVMSHGRFGSGVSSTTGQPTPWDDMCVAHVDFGTTDATAERVGTIKPTAVGFGRYRLRLPHVTAGMYVIRFRGASTSSNTDAAILLDDVTVSAVGEEKTAVAFEVPNGDFETINWRSTYPRYLGILSTLNIPQNWTLDVSASDAPLALTNSCVAVASPAFTINGGSTLMSGLWNVSYGCSRLLFMDCGGKARTTFTAPQGRFRLRADVACNGVTYKPSGYSEITVTAVPSFTATLTLADSTEIDLGSITPDSRMETAMCWPNEFEIPSSQQVTLSVRQSIDNGCGTVDNLVFVTPAASADGLNLFVNPGAESEAEGWEVSAETNVFEKSFVRTHLYSNSSKYLGYSAFDGDRYFMLRNTATITQTVSIPVAGLYRLKCHVRTRADSSSFANNNIRVWYVKEGEVTTNILDTVLMPYSGNFLERAWLVNFTEATSYKIGFSGLGVDGDNGATADRETMLDGLSLVRVEGTVDEVPLFETKPRINVVQGSRLVLDFPGTLRTGTVTLGGVQHTGLISADTHPEYIGGIGTIDARYGGIAISFK